MREVRSEGEEGQVRVREVKVRVGEVKVRVREVRSQQCRFWVHQKPQLVCVCVCVCVCVFVCVYPFAAP